MFAGNYIMKSRTFQHLSYEKRCALASDWNKRIEANDAKLTIRSFAREHNLSATTWHREYYRGAEGLTVRNLKHPGRRKYSRYNPDLAQEKICQGNLNKGAGMKMTNTIAKLFAGLVKDPHHKYSPASALKIMKHRLPGVKLPCLRSFYNHIDYGDIGVLRGETPYKPGKRRKKRHFPRPPKVRPDRTLIDKRPNEANERLTPKHYEMDTVVSRVGGKGGLLVLIDRMTRFIIIEKLPYLTGDCVKKALRRMIRRNALKDVKSITTDNGSEFLDQSGLEKLLGCNVYYTNAYASSEKGSVENANRIIRRWYPKGTDFSCITRANVIELERNINDIPRGVLGGLSAAEYNYHFDSYSAAP